MKKPIQNLIRGLITASCLLLICVAVIFADKKITAHRATAFCDAAMLSNDSNEIKALLSNTNGAGHSVFFDNVITVQFDLIFPERYVCVIMLDDEGKPSSMEVNYKD